MKKLLLLLPLAALILMGAGCVKECEYLIMKAEKKDGSVLIYKKEMTGGFWCYSDSTTYTQEEFERITK